MYARESVLISKSYVSTRYDCIMSVAGNEDSCWIISGIIRKVYQATIIIGLSAGCWCVMGPQAPSVIIYTGAWTMRH